MPQSKTATFYNTLKSTSAGLLLRAVPAHGYGISRAGATPFSAIRGNPFVSSC